MKTSANSTTGQRSTYSVIFYIKKSVRKKNGLCPLMGRITIDGDSRAFSLQTDANPDLWDADGNRMTGKNRHALAVNRVIEDYRKKIDSIYTEILYTQGYITAEIVKNALEGRGKRETGLIKLYKEHNDEFRLRVGVDRLTGTYIKYCITCDRLSDFLHDKHNANDMMIQNLTLSFIEDYDFYLRHTKNMANNTVSDHMTHLKKIIRRAMKQGTLKKDPFFGYNHRQTKMVCRYLHPEELERIMQMYISCKDLCRLRDIFVFSCFTGLAYVDVQRLSEEHLQKGDNGKTRIFIERQKTKTGCHIPLMKLPLQIIEKYRSARVDGKLFHTIPAKSLGYYFRKLEVLCGVKHITFHVARHTFATQILLSGGVSIASISRILGHTSVQTTQIYAKVTSQKVNEDMKILSGQMKGRYVLPENGLAENGGNKETGKEKM